MNLIKMLKMLYAEMFSAFFDNENDMDRIFNDVEKWHASCLPESEKPLEAWYAKIFKSNAFGLVSPIVYSWLKFQAMKYTNNEYLQSLIDKHVQDAQKNDF
ncbi:MAG: hypothetical protein DCE86_15035 [Flavobacteriaceae bacterium]|nr:MAG: hypothetical protein DCE86_15035 [Flavobacteriaceae bacterium]